jgi:hypothetical protein
MRFQLHYRFDVDFCAPARGNEKGNVENKVGYSRRQWLCPLQPLNSFEELGEELAIKAIRDMDRPHYKKGRSIADMWREEQSALLPLPSVPFEAVRLDAAVLNNYAQFRFESETYSAPQGKPRQKVLLSVNLSLLGFYPNLAHLQLSVCLYRPKPRKKSALRFQPVLY